jgi:hypothetical protein
VVLVTFGPPCPAGTGTAIIGGMVPATVSANDPTAPNPFQTQFVTGGPNNDTFFNNPVLTKAQLDPTDPDGIDYFFDRPITDNGAPGNWLVVLSTGAGGTIGSAGESQIATNEIKATFAGQLKAKQEYAVSAVALGNDIAPPGGVKQVANPQNPNLTQSAPVGDNAGAFANGFTTGNDVPAVSFNSAADQATVSLDQRLCVTSGTIICSGAGAGTNAPPVATSDICLEPKFGGSSAGGPGACGPNGFLPTSFGVTNPGQGPGGQAVTLQFPALTVRNGGYILFEGCTEVGGGAHAAFETPLNTANTSNGICDTFSVSQQVAPIGSGAILKAIRANKATIARKHRKHHKHHKH